MDRRVFDFLGFLSGEESTELVGLILGHLDERDASPVLEVRLVLNIDDLSSGVYRPAIHDDSEIISLADE